VAELPRGETLFDNRARDMPVTWTGETWAARTLAAELAAERAELAGERAARQVDQEQLAAARAAADRATAELVELARRLAQIAETQAAAESIEAEPEPPPRSRLGRAWGWFLRN
jgi:hypothetical protein